MRAMAIDLQIMILGSARARRPGGHATEHLELAPPVCCLHTCVAKVHGGVIGMVGGVIDMVGGVIGMVGGVIGRRVGHCHCFHDGQADGQARLKLVAHQEQSHLF